MNRRKGVLECARKSNCKLDKESEKYKQLQIVLNVMLRYYEIYDIDNNTSHFQIISLLYMSDKYYTYNQICDKFYISKNTLIRYIEKYDDLAIKIIKQLNLSL